MKPILVLLITALGGCHPSRKGELFHLKMSRDVAPTSVDTTTYSSPPSLDTLEAFVDQFPERVKQQVLFIQKQYIHISDKKDQLRCYERFRKINTDTPIST